MSTTEQTTADPVTSTPAQPVLPLPSVEYNLAGKTIMATVVISASKTNSDEYDYQIPPICVPGPTDSTWSVEWRLVAVTSGLSAIFTDPAVIVPNPMPPDIVYGGASILFPSFTKCLAQLTNKVAAIDYFKYKLALSVSLDGRILGPSMHDSTVDPTIAVVKDPMGG